MRLSVDKNDAGYSVVAFNAAVLLDGKPIKFCVTADDEHGWCRVYKTDATGKFYLEDGYIAEEVLYGDVVIMMGVV